ncbi:MAG: multidrug efflux pump subunit AcrB [Phenylobacterium sp.]|jgi:multidrug efflux pump subunit AcrB
MTDTNKGLIAWFARNSVAANLLMIAIIIGGLLSYFKLLNKQMFPQLEINWIEVNVSYPGAAPQEVEEGFTIRVEEALKSLQGLDRIITYSNRNASQSYLRVDESYDPQEILNEVKAQIDSISSFPEGMERPRVERIKFRQEVQYLSLYGDLTPRQLKELGKQIHDEIQMLPGISISEFYGGLNYEIGIEISKDKLREYGLSFRDVAAAVQGFSANQSAGQIKTAKGYISLRVENQAYSGIEFENLPLLSLADGTQVKLGDVATVKDGFVDGIQYSKFNGKNSTTFFIGASKDQSMTDVADVIDAYIAQKAKALPEGVKLESWVDMTYYLNGRLDMMLDNMKYGGVLVFLMLALFLRLRLAFWVMMGLPIAFLGTLLVMPFEMVGVTINVMSLFAFILVLGIVVDDAIVIGESAHAEIEEKGQSLENVIRGVNRVAMPATFGVLTTVAAFVPMVIDDGPGSAFSHSIGFVVIFCLLFSLVESKLILPAHLAKMKYRPPNPKNPLDWLRGKIDGGLKYFIEQKYQPVLKKMIHYRYTVILGFISVFLISGGMFAGGMVRFVGQPKIPHDFPAITIDMTVNSSEKATMDATLQIEKMVYDIDKQIIARHGQTMISDMQIDLRSRTSAQIMVKLVDPELRTIDTFELSEMWREAMPVIPGVKSLSIRDNLIGNQRDDGDISFRLAGKDIEQLEAATMELKAKLRAMKGVGDINDSMQTNADEVQLVLKPLAYNLGLTLSDVAAQVSFGFYGLEAQRILRKGEEIRVMVRYPEEQRNSISLVQHVLIKTPTGVEVPLSEVATINIVEGVTSIRREGGQRTLNVWASVDDTQAEPMEITKEIRDNYLPELLRKYTRVSSEVAGQIKEEMDSRVSQLINFLISLLVIYALLAIPLRSYSQPLIIMSVIPFGIIGAVFGHMILGMDMSALSLFGIIAASGVVVNDSLVMVDYVNKAREQGIALKDAVVHAGCRRFRAIFLTSLTTFIGLIPIIMETSMQAKMVIPMAVSLAFGVLFATVVTLCLIPCLYVALEDFKNKVLPRLGRFLKLATGLSLLFPAKEGVK